MRSRLGSKRQLETGRWQIRVKSGYRADGKPRVVTETLDSEADADKRIMQLAVQMQSNRAFARGVTLGEMWDAYVADKGQRLARKTLSWYTHYMNDVWLPRWRDVDVTRIQRTDVQRELLTLPSRGKADRSRRVLSSVLTYAANAGAIDHNPIRKGGFEMPGDTGSTWEDEGIWDADPFAAIERTSDVWDASTVMRALPLMRGLPLEAAWLAMVGAGLRVEEALALRRMDVRRVLVGDAMATQLAVHHARTDMDERKRTKTKRSVRIVTMMEPFGVRLWVLAHEVGQRDLLCGVSASNQNKRWRSYFAEPRTHKRMAPSRMVSGRLRGLPYIPLSRMRATHETLMQEAGVLDSLNAAVHGHSEAVSYAHYKRGDTAAAVQQTENFLRLVV